MIKKIVLSGLFCAMLGGSVFAAADDGVNAVLRAMQRDDFVVVRALAQRSIVIDQKKFNEIVNVLKNDESNWYKHLSTLVEKELEGSINDTPGRKIEFFGHEEGNVFIDVTTPYDQYHQTAPQPSQPSVAPRGGMDAVSAAFEVFGGQNMYIYLQDKQKSSFSLKNNKELEWNINKIYELQNNETFINEVKSRMEQSPSQVIVSSPVSSSSSSSAHRAPSRIDHTTKPEWTGSLSSLSSSSWTPIAQCDYVPGGARYAQVEAKMREQGYSLQPININYGTGETTAWLPNSISQGGGSDDDLISGL